MYAIISSLVIGGAASGADAAAREGEGRPREREEEEEEEEARLHETTGERDESGLCCC